MEQTSNTWKMDSSSTDVCSLKYQQKHLPAQVAPPSSARVFDLVAAEPRGRRWVWGRKSDWGRRSNLLLIMSCHLQTGAPTHSHRPRVHEPLTCYSHWCLVMCLFRKVVWTLFKVWPLTFPMKNIQDCFLVPHTYVHTLVLRVKSLTFWPFWSKVSTNQESWSEQKGQWTPLTVHYNALALLVCVCQQVKSLSIGTIETQWIDSNDWFYPCTPPRCVYFATSKLKSDSESRVAGHDSIAHSRLSLTSNASGCKKACDAANAF